MDDNQTKVVLVERLRERARPFTAAKDGFRAHCPLVNPDGPEAADTIEKLVEALRSAPGLPTSFDQYDLFASQYRVFREKRTALLAKLDGDAQ